MQSAPSFDRIIDNKFDEIVCRIDLTEWERRMLFAVANECVRAQMAADRTVDVAEIARFRRWMALEAKLEAKS